MSSNIIYVNYNTKEKIDKNTKYYEYYNNIKQDKTNILEGYILNNNNIIEGICCLKKHDTYIEILVLYINHNLRIDCKTNFIEVVFYNIQYKYDTIKVISYNGMISLNIYLYGANYINYDIYNFNHDKIDRDIVMKIDRDSNNINTYGTYNKYQILYFKKSRRICCNLLC
jgi:hypothetical protein